MKKLSAAVLAAIILAVSLTACSNGSAADTTAASSETTTAVSEAAETTAAEERVEIPTVDDNKIIASVTRDDIENKEYFDIKWGDFKKEYYFYLQNYSVDETLASNADTCKELRSQIIDYLTREKIMLRVAELNNLGSTSLTADEMNSIDESVQGTISSWIDNFKDDAAALLDEGYTDDQLKEKEQDLFDAYLAGCGYTTDIFTTWQTNTYIISKLANFVYQDLTVTDEEVDSFIDSAIEQAKKDYETDVSTYESTAADIAVYIPEGTRNIKHILFSIDDATQTEITSLRSEGKDDEADAKRDEALVKLKDEADKVLALVKNGSDFDGLISQYSDDQDGPKNYPEGYMIVPNSKNMPADFVTAAYSLEKIGDTSELVATDYGYHILCYSSDAVITDETKAEVKDSARETLLSQKQSIASQEALAGWQEKYPYTIDYETLRIDNPDAAAETTETAAAETSAETTAQ